VIAGLFDIDLAFLSDFSKIIVFEVNVDFGGLEPKNNLFEAQTAFKCSESIRNELYGLKYTHISLCRPLGSTFGHRMGPGGSRTLLRVGDMLRHGADYTTKAAPTHTYFF